MTSRQRRVVAGLLLVAALGGAVWLAGFAPHTDDGCQTEIHCLACRTAFTAAPVAATAHGPAIALAPVGSAATPVEAVPADGATAVASSRGPPLSS